MCIVDSALKCYGWKLVNKSVFNRHLQEAHKLLPITASRKGRPRKRPRTISKVEGGKTDKYHTFIAGYAHELHKKKLSSALSNAKNEAIFLWNSKHDGPPEDDSEKKDQKRAIRKAVAEVSAKWERKEEKWATSLNSAKLHRKHPEFEVASSSGLRLG